MLTVVYKLFRGHKIATFITINSAMISKFQTKAAVLIIMKMTLNTNYILTTTV
jgi:hypothetical protein